MGKLIQFILPLAGALAAAGASVTLSWDVPPPDEEISGYIVRWGTQSGDHDQATNVGHTFEAKIPDLAPTNYYFVVTAYNLSGLESPKSEELMAQLAPPKPPLPVVRPDPPNSLRIVRRADVPALEDTIVVAWTPATRTLPETTYFLYGSTNVLSASSLATAAIKVHLGTNTTAILREVPAGRWSFAVTAARGALESFPANILVVEVSPAPVTPGILIDVGPFRVFLP